jgi:hypothetical protein
MTVKEMGAARRMLGGLLFWKLGGRGVKLDKILLERWILQTYMRILIYARQPE